MPGPKPATRPKYRLKENSNFLLTKNLVKSSSKVIKKMKDVQMKTPEGRIRLNKTIEQSSHAKATLRDFILRDYLKERLKKANKLYVEKVFHEINQIHLIKEKFITKNKAKAYNDVIKKTFKDLRGFESGSGKSGKLIRKEPIADNKICEYLRERRIILEHTN